jgi:hypothetical protein
MTHSASGSVKRSTSATNFTAGRRSLRLGTRCMSLKHLYGKDKSQLPFALIPIAEIRVPTSRRSGSPRVPLAVNLWGQVARRRLVRRHRLTRRDP